MLPCITKNIINYLVGVSHNNTKAWVDAHRSEYQCAKKDFEELVQVLIERVREFDTTIPELQASKCTYRPNRDIRFTKDKRPYKEFFGAFISPNGKNWDGAGYYIHIEPLAESFIAVGNYKYNPTIVANFRQVLVKNPKPFATVLRNVVDSKQFHPLEGEQLKRIPKGFDDNFAYADLLKFTSYAFRHTLVKSEVQSVDFVEIVADMFKLLTPFAAYINSLRVE